MMDFVISKVAMSICALLIAGILAGVFEGNVMFRPPNELVDLLSDFCSLADETALSGSEATVAWTVPFMDDRKPVSMLIGNFTVRAECQSETAIDQPVSLIRTWFLDSMVMNSTKLRFLDSHMPCISAHSGQIIELVSRLAILDGRERMMLFADIEA